MAQIDTGSRILEQLALGGELNVSELARTSGPSYPTTLYKVSASPFVTFEREGRQKKVKIKDEAVDIVYPFLAAMQSSMAKKSKLTFAFLSRKGLTSTLLGGELALGEQLPVKDADPDPEIVIMAKNPRIFRKFIRQVMPKTMDSDLVSNCTIIKDRAISHSKKIGLLRVSRPEKLLTDAIAEKQSKIFIENIAESMANPLRE